MHKVLLAVAAVVLAACTPNVSPSPTPVQPPVAAVAAPTPSPVVSHAVTPAPTHAVTKPRPKPKPATRHWVTPKPHKPSGCGVTVVCCVQYQPCHLPPVTSPVWHVTYGCTPAWLKAMGLTKCPPKVK